jgi:hypothetical protein
MKHGAVIAFALAAIVWDDRVCTHADRGETRPVSLDAVGRAQDEIKRQLALSWDKSLKISLDAPFDSGLPACGLRQTRRIRTTVPADLVGKTIAFGPADRLPSADVRVATSARKIVDVQADALSDRTLTERLGVRCTPTIVRALSEVELELVENP